MRVTADTIEIGEYKFTMEFDSGDSETPFTLWVFKSNKPVYYKNGQTQVRKDFRKNYNKKYLQNFCIKFVNNESYRNSIINSK